MTTGKICPHSVSAARLFLQVAAQRTSPPRFFDIFLPASTVRYLATARHQLDSPAKAQAAAAAAATAARRSPNHGTTNVTNTRPPPPPPPRRRQLPPVPPSTPTFMPIASGQQRRAFSGTPTRRETKTLHNPQADEDGKEMSLEITPRAAKRLSEIMAKDNNPQLALRIQVESGGCHGFQYLMRLVTLPPTLPTGPAGASTTTSGDQEQEPVVGEDDTVFYFAQGSADPLAEPKIILDQPSLELLKGSKVDFTMELIGSQFKIVDNPLATSSCGCGTSFDVKI